MKYDKLSMISKLFRFFVYHWNVAHFLIVSNKYTTKQFTNLHDRKGVI